MYKVRRTNNKKYGKIISITRVESGGIKSPFLAYEKALALKLKKIIVDNQLLTNKQLEKWAREEYQSLPKCQECWEILNGTIYKHRLAESFLFCTQSCADRNYLRQLDNLNDYEEFDL